MASLKQQEEKRIQFLRKMVALPHNRHCFDCGQRGPTYVNMTIGSYVCTACSGILRGINPPHRVKSISMASFTQEEVDLLTQRGNEYNKHVWLGMHETKEPPSMDTKDEIKVRDYLTQKYEKKRWYLAPTDSLAEAAKTMNNQTSHQSSANSGSAIRRPIGGFRISTPPGSSHPVIPKTLAPPAVSTQPVVAAPAVVPTPAAVSAPVVPPQSAAQQTATNSSQLLADVFAPSSSVSADPQANNEFEANFANFADLKPTSQPAAAVSADTQPLSSQPLSSQHISWGFDTPGLLDMPSTDTTNTTSAAFHGGSALLTDMTDSSVSASAGSTTSAAGQNGSANQWSAHSAAPGGGGDKYAQLTGLFSDMTELAPAAAAAPPPQAAAPGGGGGGVNWNSINWGGGGGAAPVQSTAGGQAGLQAGGQGAINWGAPPGSQPAMVAPNTASGFGMSTTSTGSNGSWGSVPSSGVNPFLVSSGAPPAQQPFAGGFAAQPQPAFGAQPQAGFGTPPNQGGFGTPPNQGGFAAFAPQQQTVQVAQTSLSTGYPYQQQPQQQQPAAGGFGGAQMGGAQMGGAQMGGAQMGAAGFNAFPAAQPASNGQFNGSVGGMQNGSSNQWGAPAANQWGAANTAQQPAQWGAAPMSNKQAASANPFLMQSQPGVAAPQQQMATNPFL